MHFNLCLLGFARTCRYLVMGGTAVDFLSVQHNPQIEHPELKSVQVVTVKCCCMSFTMVLSVAYIILA